MAMPAGASKGLSLFAFFVNSWTGAAQSGQQEPRILDAGYEFTLHQNRVFAAGQPVTLFVYDSSLAVSSRFPTGPELPTELDGFSVVSPPYGPIPIIGIQRTCAGLGSSCPIAVIVQIPYELRANPRIGPFQVRSFAVRREAAPISTGLAFYAYGVNVHVLRSGQILSFRQATADGPGEFAQHADGTWVTADHPAISGELLTMWAVGLELQPDSPRPQTGRRPGPGHVATVGLRHDFGVNLPAQPLGGDGLVDAPATGLISAELEPDRVGVFRIVFRVPHEIPPSVPRCGGPVLSNYTVTLGYPEIQVVGLSSIGGAPLCVDTGV